MASEIIRWALMSKPVVLESHTFPSIIMWPEDMNINTGDYLIYIMFSNAPCPCPNIPFKQVNSGDIKKYEFPFVDITLTAHELADCLRKYGRISGSSGYGPRIIVEHKEEIIEDFIDYTYHVKYYTGNTLIEADMTFLKISTLPFSEKRGLTYITKEYLLD